LAERKDLSLVHETLLTVSSGDCYLDSDPACEALAACEVIARLKGNTGPRDASTETVDAWVAAHPQPVSPDLVRLATAAIDRILGENSELAELWAESDSADEWRTAVEDLRRRVAA
jgi:hypothetical protein